MSPSPCMHVHLSSAQRTRLLQITQSAEWSDRVQKRAMILLLSDLNQPLPDGARRKNRPSQESLARALKLNIHTVDTVCHRFSLEGLDAAVFDNPRAEEFDGKMEPKNPVRTRPTPRFVRPRWTMKLLTEQWMERRVVGRISNSIVWQRLKKQDRHVERAGSRR